ncbi:hypothetical protein ACLOAV_006705 [Pseudogymnoascus australis]
MADQYHQQPYGGQYGPPNPATEVLNQATAVPHRREEGITPSSLLSRCNINKPLPPKRRKKTAAASTAASQPSAAAGSAEKHASAV